MKTFSEYAKEHGMTYEAVRKSVKKHPDVFEGHVMKIGKSQGLDDEGEKILDEMRGGNPVVVIQESKDDTMTRLKEQNDALKVKIIELQNDIIRRGDEYTALQTKYVALLEQKPAETHTDAQEATEAPSDGKSPAEGTEGPKRANMTFLERVRFVFGK